MKLVRRLARALPPTRALTHTHTHTQLAVSVIDAFARDVQRREFVGRGTCPPLCGHESAVNLSCVFFPLERRKSYLPLSPSLSFSFSPRVRFLLGAGVDASARTDNKLTALHIACESGFTDTARCVARPCVCACVCLRVCARAHHTRVPPWGIHTSMRMVFRLFAGGAPLFD